MGTDFKKLVFATLGFIFSLGFIGDIIESRSVLHAALFCFELILFVFALALLVFFWIWLAQKIFKE